MSWLTPFRCFCTYIVFLVLLPSGSVFGVNIKVLIFVPVALFALKRMLQQRDALYQLAVSAGLLTLFLGWIFVAQCYAFYNVGLSLLQYRDIITTFAGCWFVRLFTQDAQERMRFIRVCLFAVAFGGLLKSVIFLYSLMSGTPISGILDGLSRIFGVQLMTFDLADAGIRIQFPSDSLIPVCLFAILCLRRRLDLSGLFSLVLVVCYLVSSVFTFSRFIWLYTAVAAVLGLVAGKRDKMHVLYVGGLTVATAYSFDLLWTIFQLRFSSQVVDSSDADRILQKGALERFFQDAPLFGHGLGSFTTEVIRSRELPYNYEMQVAALSGQVGTIGILLLLGALFNYYRKAFTLERESLRYQGAVLLLLLCFLSAGFFNPYLISSIAAATFGLLFALASLRTPTEVLDEWHVVRSPGGLAPAHG